MKSEKLSPNTSHEIIFLYVPYKMQVIRGDYWKSGVLNRPKGFIQEADIQIVKG